jgi:hypothetical protein
MAPDVGGSSHCEHDNQLIAVTPAMIAAGVRVLEEHYLGDGQYAITDDCIIKMYLKMKKAES